MFYNYFQHLIQLQPQLVHLCLDNSNSHNSHNNKVQVYLDKANLCLELQLPPEHRASLALAPQHQLQVCLANQLKIRYTYVM